jgi:dienelactone hydrolase
VRHWLLRYSVAAIALLGALSWIGYRYARTGFVTPRSAAALDAELRPHDRAFAPAGSGPYPAVALFHGCGGDAEHQREWGEFFAHGGFFALAVDSYAGRGISPEQVCAGRALLPAVRSADALVSLAALRRDSRSDATRIALAGWSHGASALIELLASDPPSEPPPALAPGASPLGLDGLAAVVLVYPYCGIGVRTDAWRSSVPVLMQLAERDSLADPAPCLDLVARLREADKPIELRVYPGVDHAFDHATLAANTTLAPPNREMAERARRDALDFLRRALHPGARSQLDSPDASGY